MFLLSFSLFAAKPVVAVMEIENKTSGKNRLSSDEAELIADLMRSELIKTNEFDVMSKEDMEEAIAKHVKKSHQLNKDSKYAIELGKQISARHIITSYIKTDGNSFRIFAEMIDTEIGKSPRSGNAKFAKNDDSKDTAIANLIKQLLGKRDEKSKNETSLTVESTYPIEVFLDGESIGKTPIDMPIKPGNHKIETKGISYEQYSALQKWKKSFSQKNTDNIKTYEDNDLFLDLPSNYEGFVVEDYMSTSERTFDRKMLIAEEHSIEQCFVSLNDEFFINQGEKKTFVLTPLESTIKISAKDEYGRNLKATVYVDDNKIGITPGTFKIPACSFKLTLKEKDQYFTTSLEFANRPKVIEATLKRILQWSKKATKVKSPENYCKNLSESGYDDWRLPTIDDFKSAIKCPSVIISGGDCQFFTQSFKEIEATKHEDETEIDIKYSGVEKELWKSEKVKVSFSENEENLAAASSNCQHGYSAAAISFIPKKEISTAEVCTSRNSDILDKTEGYDVRCVR